MVRDKKKILMIALITVVLLLGLTLLYLLVIQPSLNGLVVQGQVDGYTYAVQQIASIAVTCQQIPLNLGNNQTINLIAVECLQKAASA